MPHDEKTVFGNVAREFCYRSEHLTIMREKAGPQSERRLWFFASRDGAEKHVNVEVPITDRQAYDAVKGVLRHFPKDVVKRLMLEALEA